MPTGNSAEAFLCSCSYRVGGDRPDGLDATAQAMKAPVGSLNLQEYLRAL